MDISFLNEDTAGSKGFIQSKGGRFVHGKTGEPVRFWAVNGPSSEIKDSETLRAVARVLARHGVNMVRIHGACFDKKTGETLV